MAKNPRRGTLPSRTGSLRDFLLYLRAFSFSSGHQAQIRSANAVQAELERLKYDANAIASQTPRCVRRAVLLLLASGFTERPDR